MSEQPPPWTAADEEWVRAVLEENRVDLGRAVEVCVRIARLDQEAPLRCDGGLPGSGEMMSNMRRHREPAPSAPRMTAPPAPGCSPDYVHLSFDRNAIAEIEQFASEDGLTVGAWVRDAIFREVQRRRGVSAHIPGS